MSSYKAYCLVHLNQRDRETVVGDEGVVHVYNIKALGTEVVNQRRGFVCRHRVAHGLAPAEKSASMEVEQSGALDRGIRIGVGYVQEAVWIF